MKIDMSPFYYLVERGVDPIQAYQRTYKNIMKNMEFRTWYRGQALGDAGKPNSATNPQQQSATASQLMGAGATAPQQQSAAA